MKRKRYIRVLEALQEKPGTARELARRTRLSCWRVSNALIHLKYAGQVDGAKVAEGRFEWRAL